jgi:methyl-accepting chemotaxis protein
MAVDAEVLYSPAPRRTSMRAVGWLQSLRGRLMLVLFAVGIIPVAVIGTLALRKQQQIYLELTGRTLSETAQYVGQILDRHFYERYGDVHAQAHSPIVQSMNAAAMGKHLDHIVQGYRPAYSLILVVDTAGKIVAANSVDGAGNAVPFDRISGVSMRDYQWFQAVTAGPPSDVLVEDLHDDGILRALYGPGPQSWAVTLTMPVERDDKVVGAIRMFCDQRAVQEIASAAMAGARANAYAAPNIRLVNAEGKSIDTASADFMRNLAGPIVAEALKPKANTALISDGEIAGVYHTHGIGAFRGLGWSVIASESTGAARKEATRGTFQTTVIVALLVLLALVFVAVLLANYLTGPLGMMAGTLQNLATLDADLSKRLPEDRGDEIGVVSRSFNTFVDNLQRLIDQVIRAGMQVTMSSTQIAAGSRQLEATMTEQVAATNEVAATTKEISATANDLAATMSAVARMSEETASTASQGQSGLRQMSDAVTRMEDATQAVSARLGVINEKAGTIASVVTTITKVADQTNLLSLNAAIEAEKAGQYGQGFAVVAREIRRLADQTAVATLDIEKMVREMKSAVSSGVMSMEKLSEQVRHSVESVREVEAKLQTIIAKVQEVTPRFESAHVGMQAQLVGAGQISEAMLQLSDSTEQTAGALRDSNRAIGELNDAATSLQSMFSRFKLTAA